MKQIQAKPRQTIPLGHRGENEARKIIFDLTDYIGTYGPGTVRLLHQRDGDPAPYIVPAVQDGDTLTWTVTDEDTAAPGTGSAELQWMVNDVLAKSDLWHTKTKAALDDGATAPPTGAEGWYQQLIAYIDSLKGAGVSEEQIAAAVEAYLLEHPVDVPVTSVNGKIGAVQLTAADVQALSQDDLQAGVDAALEQAKASGEFDGAPGDHGTDGKDGADGQPGPAGADGADGAPGADGKSAYQYAQEGGYTGTEAEFAAKLAEEMPDKLPNPNALTFTGSVSGSYDGSAPLSVEIPTGGGSGSGKAKTEKLIDVTFEEATAMVSVTLEHNFHRLYLVWSCGSNGVARIVDTDGNAASGSLCLCLDSTSASWNERKIGQIGTNTNTWQSSALLSDWTDDVSTFIGAYLYSIATGVSTNMYNVFGGTTAMAGTLGANGLTPTAGRTLNVFPSAGLFAATTRIVLVGEYYE